jgi:hypothetical protein
MSHAQIKEAQKWLPNGKTMGDEKIVMFLRRHWFVLLTKYLLLIVIGVLPLGLYGLIITLYPAFFQGQIAYSLTILFTSLYYLFIWISFYTVFLDYYLDVWIVTTHRIIDREQKGLFHVVISEQSLEQIQDVSSNVQGVLPTLLEYGTVLIQSAGAKNLFNFKEIPEPEIVVQEIAKLAQDFRDHHLHEVNRNK